MSLLTRRLFLTTLGSSALLLGVSRRQGGWTASIGAMASEALEVTYPDAEWRTRLTPDQYDVLRKEGTEQPF